MGPRVSVQWFFSSTHRYIPTDFVDRGEVGGGGVGSQKRAESYPVLVSTGRTSTEVKTEVQREQRDCRRKCDSRMESARMLRVLPWARAPGGRSTCARTLRLRCEKQAWYHL